MAVNINVPSQVRTFANLAAFPATGALKTIYIAEDTNKTYRWTGSVYVEVSASASGITIGSTAIASGVVGRVLFEGAGNVVQESSSLFWDATNNRLGIGTSSPSFDLDIVKNANAQNIIQLTNTNTGSSADIIFLLNAGGTSVGQVVKRSPTFGGFSIQQANDLLLVNNGLGDVGLFANVASGRIKFAAGGALSAQMTLASTGNILINTTTDAGFKLDVNGTARVQTSAYFATISGSVGIGTASPQEKLDINGSLRIRLNSANLTAVQDTSVIDYVNTSIFTTTPALRISAVGTTSIAAQIRFLAGTATEMNAGTAERMRIFGTGNVGINTTTDAGFRLDVNGTARVSGQVTGLKFVATNNGDSFMVNGFGVLDYGDGCRINYANGAQKVTIYSNVSGGGMSLHNSGNVSIGSSATEVTSAILNVPSTTKGFLPPRMTTTQKNAIATPVAGLMVYDTTLNVISYYNGTMWI